MGGRAQRVAARTGVSMASRNFPFSPPPSPTLPVRRLPRGVSCPGWTDAGPAEGAYRTPIFSPDVVACVGFLVFSMLCLRLPLQGVVLFFARRHLV